MSKIIRSKRNTPFVQIDKTGPEDEKLSWKAKGILAYILCKPDDWQIYVAELCKHAKDGKDATASGINELIKAGYIVRKRQHDDNGKFAGYDYQVFENPAKSTVSGKPVSGKPVSGKPATTNNDNSNNNLTKKRKNKANARAKKTKQKNGKGKTTVTVQESPSKKVSESEQIDESFLTEPVPDLGQKHWTEVARLMADYFKDENGMGKKEWEYMCDAAGGFIDPMVITTMWAGKASPYDLANWKNHTGKLTNWIKNNLRSDRTTDAKIKSLNKSNTQDRLKVQEYESDRMRDIKISRVPV